MTKAIRYRVTGMDCAACAAKITRAVQSAGVADPTISTATQILTLPVAPDDPRLGVVERAIADAGYHLAPIDQTVPATPVQLMPAYRRALWIVVGLNLGYALIEMTGGFVVGSQALKADALDFLGDGLITAVGVLAIGWRLGRRARSALLQGLFLGALGLGVLADTFWRLFSQQPIEAGWMGAFAVVALVINLLAALALVPHRAGDANVRAVWLFSRNDAIANAAVVGAAGLVGWTGTAWPDLAVAFAIAALFLHSSWVIMRDARRELADSGPSV